MLKLSRGGLIFTTDNILQSIKNEKNNQLPYSNNSNYAYNLLIELVGVFSFKSRLWIYVGRNLLSDQSTNNNKEPLFCWTNHPQGN